MLMRSQENGGKVIYMDHNYSVTASKADEWIRNAPGTDVVFALSLAKIIIDDNAYDRHFMTTYTDAPILVNPETKMRIRADEVEGLEAPEDTPQHREAFAIWRNGGPDILPVTRLDDIEDVEIEGEFPITLKNGTKIMAKPVFQLTKEHLEGYDSKSAAELCMIPEEPDGFCLPAFSPDGGGNARSGILVFYPLDDRRDVGQRIVAVLVVFSPLNGKWPRNEIGSRCE